MINYQPPAGVPSQPPTQSPLQLPSEQYDHSLQESPLTEFTEISSIFPNFSIIELFNKLVNIFVEFFSSPYSIFAAFGETPLYH